MTPRRGEHPVILLHADAPPKPAVGAACNGCGVCCAWQPCPLGVLVSRRRHGACTALLWHDEARQYRCALVWGARRRWPGLPRAAEALLKRLARRWIAAGIGCDCEAEVQRPAASPTDGPTACG
ncbi:hypothetical protein AACH10_09800 [Ideonella sp. DXS22W]|uniref:4Fe-4S ferredoxin-type domain-containing protein n=1 Tax=Pseudaquabacterium inlustre TaxID=2984192 RepID=A0ABU9CF80_9BURK